MDPKPLTMEFDTEAEALSFTEGLDAATSLLDNDHLSYDMEVVNDKWVVSYWMTC